MSRMIYQSTRSDRVTATAAQAILSGIAPDGGLYTPRTYAREGFDYRGILQLDPLPMAAELLSLLLPGFSSQELLALVKAAYIGKFETTDVTPTVRVGDDHVLELFRGPTSAFKDVALCLLPHLMRAAADKCGSTDEILILTATSGDTGKAALAGFCDVPGTRIIVFYPEKGVSAVQKAQMITQTGSNVKVCAVRGNFDDAQSGVKRAFQAVTEQDLLRGHAVRLSSANSINIGRLAPQVVYYFSTYKALVQDGTLKMGESADYAVPTGNFGDILAGFIARQLGLPVGRLICASNANNVLTDFLRTGIYDRRRPFHLTLSPSMDILISSNLERLLFLLSGDAALVACLMDQLAKEGRYQVPDDLLQRMQSIFYGGFCDDEATKAVIGQAWKQHGYLMDTHTAVAWHVAKQYQQAVPNHRPVVVLSTASPYKFPEAVLSALGQPPCADGFAAMSQLHAITGVPVPPNLCGLDHHPTLHRDVIGPSEILDYVLTKAVDPAWNR